MPLYAYLKIPGIENSESRDELYGSKWIPIQSIEGLSHQTADLNDTVLEKFVHLRKDTSKNSVERLKEIRKLRDDHGKLLDYEKPGDDAKTDTGKSARKGESNERLETIGTLKIIKHLDATSPPLQKLCLECFDYDPDQYIASEDGDGRIELHICRQIPDETDPSVTSNVIYMAYMMEKCLITGINFDASEQSKITETITISFEIIYSYMYWEEDRKWETKGWDFVEGKEISAGGYEPKPKP